ncbi:Equilibrative nucleotide transporter 3 [Abeliophyllum distichum]|uniref:Equilibrative nucleotide transporter 3 n=1 Tax=Abeliophyllum distichum TaxID=126358 RepID=A0ABD1QGU5_9LAMI
MTNLDSDGIPSPSRLQGKYKAMVVCWFLGLGSLVSWNSMLTIGDYYYNLFPSYHPSRVLTLVYQPFALGTMLILTYNEAKIDTRKRNLMGYIIFFFSTLGLLVLDLGSSGKGGIGNYIGICVFVAAFGVAEAYVQGGMVGDLSFMRPEFVQNDIAKHERLSNKQLLFQNLDYALDLYLIYVLTLSIFPGFLYENTGSHQLGSWYPAVLIAMYNVLDFIGRYTSLIKIIKLESRKGLLIASLSRFLLIPAFYFTAKYGDQGWMIMLVSFLGLTNGHLTVCVLTTAPKGYKAPEQNALGNLLVLFLLCGVFSGVALDWLWIIGNGKF